VKIWGWLSKNMIFTSLVGLLVSAVVSLIITGIAIGRGRLRATQRILASFEFHHWSLGRRSLAWLPAWLVTIWSLFSTRDGRELYRQMRLRVEHDLLRSRRRQRDDARYVSVATVGDIFRHRRRLTEYLEHVTADKQNSRVLSPIRVEGGLVAPLYLLGGLLAAFNEDWGPLIRAYDRASFRADDPLGAWRTRQKSMFLVWLIWGPSIPICRCSRWKDAPLMLQYGYGDENNSIPLWIPDEKRAHVTESLKQSEDDPSERSLALRWSVTGTLRTAPDDERRLSHAQHRLRGTLVLEYESHTPTKTEPPYYTAYVWVMFRICNREWRPLVPASDGNALDGWLNFLPFFEHANIVDRQAYEAAKRQLASKVLPTLQRIIEDVDPNDEIGLRLRYACAIDDAACRESRELAFPLSGDRIRDLLVPLKKGMSHHADRVDLDHPADPSFSACHLPDMIGSFCDAMKDLAVPPGKNSGHRSGKGVEAKPARRG
jgi:hypothetical protein